MSSFLCFFSVAPTQKRKIYQKLIKKAAVKKQCTLEMQNENNKSLTIVIVVLMSTVLEPSRLVTHFFLSQFFAFYKDKNLKCGNYILTM